MNRRDLLLWALAPALIFWIALTTAGQSIGNAGNEDTAGSLPDSARTAVADFQIPWSSVNGGGGPSSSASHTVNGSAGQGIIGFAGSVDYQVGSGYWYGAALATSGCQCDCHADPQCDHVTNVLDVVHAVNVAFRGSPDIVDPNVLCPYTTTDADCSGYTDVIDVVKFVNVAFRGGLPEVNFCDPCP